MQTLICRHNFKTVITIDRIKNGTKMFKSKLRLCTEWVMITLRLKDYIINIIEEIYRTLNPDYIQFTSF